METADKLDEIYAWIDTISLSRPKRNIARDFSDAVLMAELLKVYYSRYVDIHNYNPGNSISKKIANWSILNRKVLSKIEMKLGKDTIEKLARSETGAIESVLLNLRNKIIKDCNADRDSVYFNIEDGHGDGINSILNASEEMTQKPVSRQAFIRVKQELQQKTEMISSLRERIVHLESIINVKDQRIIDLECRNQQINFE